jgi:hypothetical protein
MSSTILICRLEKCLLGAHDYVATTRAPPVGSLFSACLGEVEVVCGRLNQGIRERIRQMEIPTDEGLGSSEMDEEEAKQTKKSNRRKCHMLAHQGSPASFWPTS